MSVRLKILLSYHYHKDTDLDTLLEKKFAPHYPEIFLDSGGFSAMTQGATINLSEYAAFLKRYAHRITTYANLDVIGDAAKTWANQQRMEALGLRPLPVFHTGETWDVLERYIERYAYIALGGLVPYIRQWAKIMPWLVRAFKLAGSRSVFHGFGVTTWQMLSRLPWYSTDSSTWVNGFRFGCLKLFNDKAGVWQDINVGDRNSCLNRSALIETYGYTADQLADQKSYSRKDLCAISAVATQRSEKWLRRRHGDISTSHNARTGIRVYMADPTTTDTASASALLNASQP